MADSSTYKAKKSGLSLGKPILASELETGKLPPQAVDVEEAVLGSLMLEKNALTAVIDILHEEMFYKLAHQNIFSAIFKLFSKDEAVDLITIANELKNSGKLESIGGAHFLAQLTRRISSTANIEFHARIIQQKYVQRELIRVSTVTVKDAYEDDADVFTLLDSAEASLFEISQRNFRRESEKMETLVSKAITQIETAMKQDDFQGVPCGLTDLDRLTGGWQKSDLIILAARPAMGKTACVLSMARNIAVDFRKGVAFFSLEMSSVQLVTRLISSESEIPSDLLRKGELDENMWQGLESKIESLVDAPLFIDDTPALSIFELRAKCRRLKEREDIQIIIIDYIQLMTVKGDFKGNREQEISTISRSLKALAKELDVPIIALSQLNRSVETRGGSKRPQLSDLRESGAIEQDADMVCFIYRPAYYGIDEDAPDDLAEFIVAKHRNGAVKDISLKFIQNFARFTNRDDNNLLGDMANNFAPNSDFIYEESQPQTFSSKMNDTPDNSVF